MSAVHPLPDAACAKDLLGMILDGVSVKTGTMLDLSPQAGSYLGVYVVDDGTPAAFFGCDIAFAANAGSALSMLSAGAAKESIKARDLTGVMLANLHEIMNICTRLILREDTPHLKLRQVYAANALAPDAAAVLGSAKRRVDMQIEIPKYGSGTICVICP